MKYLHPRRYYNDVKRYILYHCVPDEWHIRYFFKKRLGYSCYLKNPRSFNEKIQWIKLHDRNPLYSKLIDKIYVKEFVARNLGSEYVIPMLMGGFSHFDEIPFDALPNQFVLKCNHDSKSTIVCKDKSCFDYQKARHIIEKSLRGNYYRYYGRQWGYDNIQPKVFVEQYMSDKDGWLKDYKFMMFNGQCKSVFYFTDRFIDVRCNCYDEKWNLLPIRWGGRKNTNYTVQKPNNFDEMLSVATKLTALVGNSFVRVDLYDVDGRVYFGEYTFYPGAGFDSFEPQEWDFIFGQWLDVG